jgi:hypothetical protein
MEMPHQSFLFSMQSNSGVGSLGVTSGPLHDLGIRKCEKGKQEVRWDKGGTERAEDYTFFYGAGNVDHQLGTVFLCIRESNQQLGG